MRGVHPVRPAQVVRRGVGVMEGGNRAAVGVEVQ